jgi:hypothetical protein
MEGFYPQAIAKGGAAEAWKKAPVAFESCWDMRKWKAEGWDIGAIFDYALAHHASYINNKSAPLPEGALPQVESLLRKLGYRLVLRRLEHKTQVRSAENLDLSMAWENVGVAPPYFDYYLALRLKRVGADPVVITSNESIRGWLPGARTVEASFPVPASLTPDRYEIAIGIVEPQGNTPAVRLAIEGRDTQGWYPISNVDVSAAKPISGGQNSR